MRTKLHPGGRGGLLSENTVEQDLLTTREVARLLGVGTTSIKRWADSEILRCVKTPGGHRRFPRDAVEEFLARNRHQIDGALSLPRSNSGDSFLHELTNGATAHGIMENLELQRRERGSWHAVANSVASILDEMGRAWARGDITVIQEHVASERLTRALCLLSEKLATRDSAAPTGMLMVAEADDHVLGLHLVELCMREAGWNVTWAGRKTPVHFACEFIASNPHVDLLAVSASEFSRDAASLADQASRLGQACEKRGIPLLLGGTGLWPEKPAYGLRLRTFDDLRSWLIDHRAAFGIPA